MKIPIKYGLMTAMAAMAWVLIAHSVVPNPQSPVHTFGAMTFFNVVHFIMIFLGVRALEREKRDRPTFKEGLKTGVWISFFYGLTMSLFFIVVVAVIGTRWIENEPAMADLPKWRIAAQAFTGIFLGAMFLGLIYSTVISFFLAKRQSESDL
jgi:uncharacterized membrane protein